MSGRAQLRIGAVGLGRAFSLMVPTFVADPRVTLVAGADPRPEARERFAAQFGAAVFDDVEALCNDSAVNVVYVASPHQHHAAHVVCAAQAGKHVLVEKPLAVTLAEADRMVDAAQRAGIAVVVGHSHSFDRPILRAREMIARGEVGDVRMISALNYTDFLYRPRRPEELVTAAGGGALFSQAAHHVDVVRLLAGGMAERVHARTGAWDATRPTEGAYAATLGFAGGAFASLVYSGYGRFDTDELCGDTAEMGEPRDPARYGRSRRLVAGTTDADSEAALKMARNYGGTRFVPESQAPRWHQHFGVVIVSCDRADLRPLPNGVMVYGDEAAVLDPLPRPRVPREEVIDELHAAVVHGRAPAHDAAWGRATLEVCLAMLESARIRSEVRLARQCPWRGDS